MKIQCLPAEKLNWSLCQYRVGFSPLFPSPYYLFVWRSPSADFAFHAHECFSFFRFLSSFFFIFDNRTDARNRLATLNNSSQSVYWLMSHVRVLIRPHVPSRLLWSIPPRPISFAALGFALMILFIPRFLFTPTDYLLAFGLSLREIKCFNGTRRDALFQSFCFMIY